VTVINEILRSPEVATLADQGQREALQEIAEDINDEAKKVSPDASRIKRWGGRFVARLGAAGLIAAQKSVEKVLLAALAALLVAAPAL